MLRTKHTKILATFILLLVRNAVQSEAITGDDTVSVMGVDENVSEAKSSDSDDKIGDKNWTVRVEYQTVNKLISKWCEKLVGGKIRNKK